MAPAAPIPSAISEAKTVFISNTARMEWGQARVYNEFYAALQAAGKYRLVSSPSDADLVFELEHAYSRENGNELDVVIYDRKTHYILWKIFSEVGTCTLKSGCEKALDRAVDNLVHDLLLLKN